jgi:hypothetical protein
MFNHYYAAQEKYKDYIKEADKERIIKQIQEANKQDDEKSAPRIDQESLAKRLALIFRQAKPSSSR